MKFAIIIPSRYASERFPGKPLELISGKSLIERVWGLAKAVDLNQEVDVIVATDDQRIADHLASFGAKYIITDPKCANGSERVFEAYKKLQKEFDVIINLQGDAVITPPWIIQAVCQVFIDQANTQCATAAVALRKEQVQETMESISKGLISGTHVVCNKDMEALYFSRYPIPFIRKQSNSLPVFRHIGLYAYTPKVLESYINLPACELEKIEGLEQLRFLYNSIPIKVVEVDYRGRSHCGIDTLEDKIKAEQIIAQEGELLN